MKNKIFMMVIAILIAITLILTAAFILWNQLDSANDPLTIAQNATAGVKAGKQPTPDEAKENTVLMEQITTNLAGQQKIIRISFAFELENKKAKEEFEKIDFKMKAIILETLAETTPEAINGKQGVDALTAALMNTMNPLLQSGKLRQVYVTDKIVQ